LAYCRKTGRPHRGLHVPHEGDALRGGSLLCAGAAGVLAEDYPIPQTRLSPISACQPRVLLTCPYDTYLQRFTFVDPFELRLARVACLVQARLGHFGQLHTEPLPAPHVPDGDRVEHYSELSLTTPLKQLRVARRVGTVHCCTIPPSEPRVRVVPAHGSSRLLLKLRRLRKRTVFPSRRLRLLGFLARI
jgi:hypothetical protein